jgi:hypothetical protein
MKTIRFGDLVRGSGRPRTVTLWSKPEDNPLMTGAMKQNRVLTVIQEQGKKDQGVIGFKSEPGALYLVFPRALPHEQDTRVVGINYQLIEEPAVLEKDRAKPTEPPPYRPKPQQPAVPQRQPEPVIPKPKPRDFIVRVRRTATVEDEIKVKALDQPAAEQLALERAKRMAFKPGKVVQAGVVKAEEREPKPGG